MLPCLLAGYIYRQVASVLSGQFASILQGILTTGTKKRIFSHKKPPAATFQNQKRVFFTKKRRLRQRTRTKNIFPRKKGACGSTPGPKKTFFCGPVCIYCTPISALRTNFLVFVSVCTGRPAGSARTMKVLFPMIYHASRVQDITQIDLKGSQELFVVSKF